MTPVIAIANQKGGVGKTTTTAHLARLLGERSRRVLAIDLDHQRNLTQYWDKSPDPERTVFQVLTGKPPLPLADAALPVANTFSAARSKTTIEAPPHHHLVPGSPVMNSLDVHLANQPYRDERLKRALINDSFESKYDYVLLDCPPALGIATMNALVAATHVLIPTVPDYLALKSLADFLTNLNEFRRDWRPDLQVLGILPVNCEDGTSYHQAAIAYLGEVAREWQTELFPLVAHTTKFREASERHLALPDYDRRSNAAFAACEALDALTRRVDDLFTNAPVNG